jgi:hypothetical protein
MRWIAVAAAALLLAISPAAFADDHTPATQPDSELTQLVTRYLEIGGDATSFSETAAATVRGLAQAQGVHASDDQWQRVHDLVITGLAPAAHLFENELIAYYAAHNTSEDLLAAIDYYQSDAGAHYIKAAISAANALILHFVSNGVIPEPQAPDASTLDATRLQHARILCDLLAARITPLQVDQMNAAGYPVERFSDFMARHFANALSLDDIDAATAWVRTSAAQHLEGQSTDRAEAIQLATTHAMRTIDFTTISAQIHTILNEAPT